MYQCRGKDLKQNNYNFQRDFESKKRMSLDDTCHVVFKLPNSICDIVLEKSKRTMEEAVQTSPYASNIVVKGDKLMFDGKQV